MAIRVTNGLMMNQVISDINKNMKLLQEIQYKLSTGNKINRPSDDPIGVTQAIKLKSSLETTGQHNKNLADGKARISASINALNRVEDLLLEIQGLAREVVNSQMSAGRGIMASEVNGLLEEVFINANAKYLGKYLFGGHESLTAPYEATYDTSGNVVTVSRNRVLDGTTEIKGIDDPINHTVAEGLDMQINISGSRPFMPNGEGNEGDIFNTIITLRDHIRNNNLTGVKNAIDDLEDEFENIVLQSSILGERLSRLESIESNNEELEILKKENLSNILNVDYAQAITDLNYQQFILESSLQVGARIIPPSLLDFI